MAFDALSRHWTVWKAAWQAEQGHALGAISGGRATEFLPAVLEIQQAPPSPIGRAILWTIMAVFASGVLWATLGWIDIVATAQGKIIPSGYSKVIQPYEAGVITARRRRLTRLAYAPSLPANQRLRPLPMAIPNMSSYNASCFAINLRSIRPESEPLNI